MGQCVEDRVVWGSDVWGDRPVWSSVWREGQGSLDSGAVFGGQGSIGQCSVGGQGSMGQCVEGRTGQSGHWGSVQRPWQGSLGQFVEDSVGQYGVVCVG